MPVTTVLSLPPTDRRRSLARALALGLLAAAAALLPAVDAPAQSPPAAAVAPTAAPQVLYTDLASGPASGGEHGKGVYLSVFGRRFGDASGLGTTVRVLIGGVEVDNYRYHGASRGRPDVQQITVQVGALGNPAPGAPLPVQVVVDGRASNADVTFTVNPGRILFVDNVLGDDANARADDIARPWRRVQTPALRSGGLWPEVRPGDVIVMRGRGADAPWTDVGFEGYFMRVADRAGSAPTGAPGTGPITFTAYPNEDVFIRGLLSRGMTGGCLSAINGKTYPGRGQWVTVANLRIDCEGYDGPISQGIHGHRWRIVNNDLAMSTAPRSGPRIPRSGGVVANGLATAILGNHIHDIQGSDEECHGIYIDGDGSYDIGWNWIHDVRDGNGFQVYVNGNNGSAWADAVSFHHNLVHDVSKHGINLADNARNGFRIWNNVVRDTARSGLRINSRLLSGAHVHHNTFLATNRSLRRGYGAVSNDWLLARGALDLRHNILDVAPGSAMASGTVGLTAEGVTAVRNLWTRGTGRVALDAAGLYAADPGLVDPARGDYRPRADSPAARAAQPLPAGMPAVGDDWLGRPRATPADLGALGR